MSNQCKITTFIGKIILLQSDGSTQDHSFSDSTLDNLDMDSDVESCSNSSVLEELQDTLTEGCSSECCDENLSQPYHPKCDLIRTKRKQGKQYRVFQMAWFDDHEWLTFCVTRNKVFCFLCRKASSRGLLKFNQKGKNAFLNTGFDNWKKAKERFKEHELCQLHNEALMHLKSLR